MGKHIEEANDDQEHRHRQGAQPAAGEDSLLGAAEDAIRRPITDWRSHQAPASAQESIEGAGG